jgi:Integrase zinc binding domain
VSLAICYTNKSTDLTVLKTIHKRSKYLHLRIAGTLGAVREEDCNVKNVNKLVKRVCKECTGCQKYKSERGLIKGKTEMITIPECPLDDLSLDIEGPFPSYQGKKCWVAVVVD